MTILRGFILSLIITFTTSQIVYSQVKYGLTVMGTDIISASEIKSKYGHILDELIADYDRSTEHYNIKKEKLNKIFLELEWVAYSNIYLFKSYTDKLNFIIDFVEKKDEKNRLRYRQVPYEDLEYSFSLLNKWIEYENLSFQLFREGEIHNMDCPVIHCIWAFNHPQLAPYLELFNQYVPIMANELVDFLNKSKSEDYRAAASFLLAHAKIQPQELLEILMPSINDPSSKVRNNSMRIIYYIVREFPDTPIDIDQVIMALNYPSFTDRNKALVILRSLSLNQLSAQNLSNALPVIFEILVKKDAHNYQNAHLVLKKISKKNYAIDDIESWRGWVNSLLKNE